MRLLLPLFLCLGVLAASPAYAKPEAPPDFPGTGPDKPESPGAEVAPGAATPEDQVESWLSALTPASVPGWAWGLGGLLVLLLLRRLFRQPERDDDLMGPPRPARYRDLPRY